jgi:hypothetical protein
VKDRVLIMFKMITLMIQQVDRTPIYTLPAIPVSAVAQLAAHKQRRVASTPQDRMPSSLRSPYTRLWFHRQVLHSVAVGPPPLILACLPGVCEGP